LTKCNFASHEADSGIQYTERMAGHFIAFNLGGNEWIRSDAGITVH
jgi:hypothetical protein